MKKPAPTRARTARTSTMSPAEIENVAERAALRAVKTVFLQLGVDMDNPLQAQRDFFHLREFSQLMKDVEFRKDLEYVRSWRTRSEAMVGRGFMALTAMVATGMATAIWLGFKSLVTTTPAP